MKVYIPTALRSYTDGQDCVNAEGATLGALLEDLDRQFEGIRFRVIDEQDQIRRHIRLFVGLEQSRSLDAILKGATEVHILCSLSGG